MSVIAESVARRIDSIRAERKLKNIGYLKYCADRRIEMARLYCDGMDFKQISKLMHSSPDNVSYAINKFMRDSGQATHAQLGAWMAKQGLV